MIVNRESRGYLRIWGKWKLQREGKVEERVEVAEMAMRYVARRGDGA